MVWNHIKDIPAPKDRVIEVTNGFLWTFEDIYLDKKNETYRKWKMVGDILIAIWNDNAQTFDETIGKWVNGGGFTQVNKDCILPPFEYWREFDNPFVAAGIVDDKFAEKFPPFGINELFHGDARKHAHEEELKREQISLNYMGKQNIPSKELVIQKINDKITKLEQKVHNSYDPPSTVEFNNRFLKAGETK